MTSCHILSESILPAAAMLAATSQTAVRPQGLTCHFCICSPDVAALLATMPTLRQPAPPPGIPAGIPPMRKATAPPSQVPCKHFAQGSCSKGDKCEFAHDPKQQGRNASKSRSAPRATPPVQWMPLSLLPLVVICSNLAALPQLALLEFVGCATMPGHQTTWVHVQTDRTLRMHNPVGSP